MEVPNSVNMNNTPEVSFVKKMNNSKTPTKNVFLILTSVVIVVLGVVTGWFLSGSNKATTANSENKGVTAASSNATEAGAKDASMFKDSAEGILREGGIGGDGTHHLERSGGVSQNVYLTSTAIDLSSFKDKKVKVWGDTLSSKKAGWLMDVGKIKVTE